MVSYTATNSNNSDTLVKPMSSSAQPPSGRYMVYHQDPLEDLRKSFSKKQMGRPLGSKNKPKTCIVIEEDTQNIIEWVGFEILIREDTVVNIIKYDQQLQHNIIVSWVSVLSLMLPFLIQYLMTIIIHRRTQSYDIFIWKIYKSRISMFSFTVHISSTMFLFYRILV